VDPRVGLDDLEKRSFFTLPGLELQPLGRQPVASRYTNCAIVISERIILKWPLTKKHMSVQVELYSIWKRPQYAKYMTIRISLNKQSCAAAEICIHHEMKFLNKIFYWNF
jgi:hypothetical protein